MITEKSAAAVLICKKTNKVFHINVCDNEKEARTWVSKDRKNKDIQYHVIPNWKLAVESVKEFQRYNY